MIQLYTSDYAKLINPLRQIHFNNLFARAVIENHVKGRVYADCKHNPKTFYVVHPYGMSLLFGNCGNSAFNRDLREYALNPDLGGLNEEWMQTFPDSWDTVMNSLFEGRLAKSGYNGRNHNPGGIELNTRVNLKFNFGKYQILNKTPKADNIEIYRSEIKAYEGIEGSVIPKHFWDTCNDFSEMGVGFCLYYKGGIASVSFSAFVHDNQLELGIETVKEFRGKGLAYFACCALIDYCIENNLEPVWACRLENLGSYKLALKLGFEPVLTLPYYRLCREKLKNEICTT